MFTAVLFIIGNIISGGTTQISIIWWMGKQNVLCPYYGILLRHKKKHSAAKWKKPVSKDHVLYDSIYMHCPEKAGLQKQR